MEEKLVFMDAGFLSKLSKHFGKGRYLVYDIINFARNLAIKQNLFCKKIFYYTAPPFQSPIPNKIENKRKENYDKFIRAISKERDILIREGRCQRIRGEKDFEFCQKGVDTLLTMDLTSVSINYPQIKEIVLILCDSDFVPIINNLKKRGIKIVLYTYYEKSRNSIFSTSNDLIKSADKYILLSKEDFDNSPLK